MNARGSEPPGLAAAAAGAMRYRFFLAAGALPYLLGAAVAHHVAGTVDWRLLLVGLAGIIFVGVGIEGMNEYFDSKIGGDRVFKSAARVEVGWHLPVGLAGFSVAFLIGAYLTWVRGWPIFCFALAGFLAALSYLLPPVQLSYRGLGETVIAFTYGPGLTLGSYTLQTGKVAWECALASLLPALLVLAVALANEVPDYYGDRLVGKRNIVVRIGRKGAAHLYGIVTMSCFALIVAGLLVGIFPALLGLALLLVPLGLTNGIAALRHYQAPVSFCPVIRRAILLYIFVTAVLTVSYFYGRSGCTRELEGGQGHLVRECETQGQR